MSDPDDDFAFWSAVEKFEEDFTADSDERIFREKMERIGFEKAIIDERVQAINDLR